MVKDRAKKKKAKKQPLSLPRKIILMICLIVFFGSGAYVAKYFMENYQAEDNMKEVAGLREVSLADVYAANNDLVGWVKVDGTKIDYPVMQTKNEPEFYLRKDFKREYSLAGTPFMDATSNVAGTPQADASESTCNWLIYGHNMKSGIMFHTLLNYDDKQFYNEHPTFEFSTVQINKKTGEVTEDRGEYQVIAACYAQILSKDSKEFKYYSYADFTSEKDYNEYVKGVKAQACYDTGQSAEFGEQLVTLSTCAYHVDNGRFYVVGRRIK